MPLFKTRVLYLPIQLRVSRCRNANARNCRPLKNNFRFNSKANTAIRLHRVYIFKRTRRRPVVYSLIHPPDHASSIVYRYATHTENNRTVFFFFFLPSPFAIFVRTATRIILNDLARRRRETISIDNIGAMKITVISLKRFQGVRPGRQLSRHARQTERD